MSGHAALLRASSRDNNGGVVPAAVTTADGRGTGVPQGDILIRFVDATLGTEVAALPAARRAVLDALGAPALVDAAGVVGAFTMQNRVADGVGLPLDAPLDLATRNLRAQLGADRFAAAAYTGRGGTGRNLLARLVEPLLPFILRLRSRRQKADS